MLYFFSSSSLQSIEFVSIIVSQNPEQSHKQTLDSSKNENHTNWERERETVWWFLFQLIWFFLLCCTAKFCMFRFNRITRFDMFTFISHKNQINRFGIALPLFLFHIFSSIPPPFSSSRLHKTTSLKIVWLLSWFAYRVLLLLKSHRIKLNVIINGFYMI